MKKIIALVVAVLMVFAMSACSGGATKSAAATTAAKTEAAAATTAAATQAPATTAPASTTQATTTSATTASAGKTAVDYSQFKASDGSQLMTDPIIKTAPARPSDPESLADDDAGKYYDMEYMGAGVTEKDAKVPASPKDGIKGKHIIVIVHGDHAWTTAYENGWKESAADLGFTVDCWSPNWDQAQQDQLIDQAINAKPDAIALIPLSADNATAQFRKITEAGIPAFGTNTLATTDSLKYMEAWTGPDDWSQMRQLADALGESLGGKGGICYITHNVGTSPYYARTYGPITEFKSKYPNITTLDIQSPGFEAADCKQVVSDWITRFGDKLNAIFLADDSAQATGTVDAIKEAGRTDIKVVAAGNSKTGQDLVKSGDLLMINQQSAEGDAGLCARTMSEWFAGNTVANVGYLSTTMITKDNVADFYPCQW